MSHEQLISVQIKVVNGAAGKALHLPCGVEWGRCAHAHLPGVSGEEEVSAALTSLPVQDSGKGIVSGAALCGSLNVPCRTNLPGQALCSQATKVKVGLGSLCTGSCLPTSCRP